MAEALPQFLRDMRGNGGDQLCDRLHGGARGLGAVGLGQVVDVLDKFGHHGIKPQVLVIIAHAGNGAVKLLEVILAQGGVGSRQLAGVLVDG